VKQNGWMIADSETATVTDTSGFSTPGASVKDLLTPEYRRRWGYIRRRGASVVRVPSVGPVDLYLLPHVRVRSLGAIVVVDLGEGHEVDLARDSEALSIEVPRHLSLVR
jgi:hypothetical protein